MSAAAPNLFFIGTSSLEFSRIDFLLFLDISIGHDNLSTLSKKEEDASDVLITLKRTTLFSVCSFVFCIQLVLQQTSDHRGGSTITRVSGVKLYLTVG